MFLKHCGKSKANENRDAKIITYGECLLEKNDSVKNQDEGTLQTIISGYFKIIVRQSLNNVWNIVTI